MAITRVKTGRTIDIYSDPTMKNKIGTIPKGTEIDKFQTINGAIRHSRGGWSKESDFKDERIIQDIDINYGDNVYDIANKYRNADINPTNDMNSELELKSRGPVTYYSRGVDLDPFNNDFLKPTMNAYGFYSKEDLDKFRTFNRFNAKDIYGKIHNVKEYVFFTKPDLNIYEDPDGQILQPELANNEYFVDLHRKNPHVLHQLQSSVTNNKSAFMNLLSWEKRGNIEAPTVNAKEYESAQNMFGTRIYFRKHAIDSDENIDFTIEFEDTRNTPVYDLLKAWNMYGDLKSIGLVSPRSRYRNNREIHDQIAIYKFWVLDNLMDIIFYCKYIGVMIKSYPREIMSDLSNGLNYNVSFKANTFRDNTPSILYHFNSISSTTGGKELPLFNTETMLPEGKLPTGVYVERVNTNYKGAGFINRLKWVR